MADIRKRKGKNGVKYQVRFNDPSTESGFGYASFLTLKEARAFTENLGSRSVAPEGGPCSVKDAIERWLNTCEKIGRDGRETVEPETLKEYQRRARVMKEYNWQKPLHELKSPDIVLFRNWLLENKSRDLARRTLSSFHSVLIEMKQQGLITDDPAAGITVKGKGRYDHEEQKLEIPTDLEMRDIYAAADQMGRKNNFMAKCWARYRPMIYLAGFTGMRPSEYRGLSWSCVSADHVLVRQRADRTGIIGPLKSKAGRRTIYLPSMVGDMLQEWREQCPRSELDLVFPTSSGKPQLLNSFRFGAWIPLLREAGLIETTREGAKVRELPKYSPYALRHYFASKLIEGGHDLKFIQTTMGHSRIEVTFNIYGHLIGGREEKHKKAADELAASILGI